MTSLVLPPALLQRVQRAARRLHWSFAEVVRDALVAWLARHAGARRSRKEARE